MFSSLAISFAEHLIERGLVLTRNTIQGCSKPLVVKFADSQKDRKMTNPASVSPSSQGTAVLNNVNLVPPFFTSYLLLPIRG
jgi:hypothetical protein